LRRIASRASDLGCFSQVSLARRCESGSALSVANEDANDGFRTAQAKIAPTSCLSFNHAVTIVEFSKTLDDPIANDDQEKAGSSK